MKRSLLLMLLVTFSATTHADTLRCGNLLVYDGDTIAKVQARCGKPSQITTSTMTQRPSYWQYGKRIFMTAPEVIISVETWVYNFGPQQLMSKLRFEDGVLISIETLDYGYHEE